MFMFLLGEFEKKNFVKFESMVMNIVIRLFYYIIFNFGYLILKLFMCKNCVK